MEIAAPQLRLQHFTPLSKITLAICLSSSPLCYGARKFNSEVHHSLN